MFIGRIIGALVGFAVAGPIAAVIGFLVGWFFDKGMNAVKMRDNPAMRQEVERAFFASVFPLMGCLAKSDGRISPEEIAGTEELMKRMGLGDEDRRQAIELFKAGALSEFDVDATVDEFLVHCGRFNNLKQILLAYLITIAYADGSFHPEEEKILLHVADRLGYSAFAFNHLLNMIRAQNHFYRGQYEDAGYRRSGFRQPQEASRDELALAYQALGVETNCDDKTLKQAYRRLMSEFHPDKLAGRGVPQDMVKMATERSQEIQAAYELIKKNRK